MTEGHAVSHARPERTSGGRIYTKVMEDLTGYVFGVEGWRWRLCMLWLTAHFRRKTVTFTVTDKAPDDVMPVFDV